MNETAPYASMGKRLLAFILDAIVLSIPCAVGNFVVPFVGGLVVWFLYAPLLEHSKLQGTLGKYWMGIQVVSLKGETISLQSALIRNLLKIVSTALLFIGFIMALFSSKKQTLHDLLAETVVVNGQSTVSIADAWSESFRNTVGNKIPGGTENKISQLERLQRLREQGAITEEEFQREKQKLL